MLDAGPEAGGQDRAPLRKLQKFCQKALMQWKLQNASHRRYFMRKCHKDHRELPAWARKALHLEQEEGDNISGAALLAAVTVNLAAPGRQCCLVKDADDLSWGKIVDTVGNLATM